MKNIISIFVALLLIGSPIAIPKQADGKLKRYNTKSAIIKYKIHTFGKIMFKKVDKHSEKTLAFVDYGAKEVQEEVATKSKDVTHTLSLLDNGVVYSVDFKKKEITKTTDAMSQIHMEQDKDMGQTGEDMLIAMGGKKVGTDEFLGYDCDVWKVPMGTMWVYDGIPLKSEMVVLGVTTFEEATSIELNVDVSDDYFKLPDFKIIDLTEEMDYSGASDGPSEESMEKMKNMSYEEYKAMMKKNDPESYENMTEEELQSSYKMMKMYSGGGK